MNKVIKITASAVEYIFLHTRLSQTKRRNEGFNIYGVLFLYIRG